MGFRPLVEVLLQCSDRLGEPAHAAEQEPAVAAVLGIRRLEDEEELDRIDRRRPVAPREMGRPEVSQDTSEDLPPTDRAEHPGVEEDAVADRSPDERLAVVRRQPPTA